MLMRIIIDTDPAMGTLAGDPEDSFAIMLALNSPEATVEGITVVQGNVPAESGMEGTTALLLGLRRRILMDLLEQQGGEDAWEA